MRLRSATSVLLTLVYCTAENNVPRWSKPDRDLGQGEWVPLDNERLNQESARIPSAINPHQFNHALHQNPSTNQFSEEYQPKQILGSQSAPPRFAFLHSQGGNPQSTLQQPQLPPQQLLSQFLNEQIGQTNLPGFSRALPRKQPLLNSNYYTPEDTYNLEPNYNQVPDFKNPQYNFDSNSDFGTIYSDADKPTGTPNQGTIKTLQPSFPNEHFSTNYSSSIPNKKEEVQILYVPVEMLRQQEEARREQARKTAKNIPLSEESLLRHQHQGSQQFNTKEAKKFRHPIQPLKDQIPAHHLQAHEKVLYPTPVAEVNTGSKNTFNRPAYTSQRTTEAPRNSYFPNYNSEGNRAVPSGNKEQYVEETAIQDEISEYRNTITRRTPQKDNRDRTHTTLPPPNQPPLSVFMESTSNNRIGDVLNLLKDSKTIPVLDSVGNDAPQVFVGPSNLNTPEGYIKYELPYLSTLNSNSAPPKLSQVPFFVAPLNFQPPPGFAKIPFPPPHIGSVVLTNVSSQQEEIFATTPHSVERHTPNYKESFTIPADISSISPQLPSLINSLQEDEYLGSSSTESITESTEEPTLKYRRPTNPRRPNNRGSQRGYTSSGTTTRRPTSRQRKPSTRYSNQRINQNPEQKSNPPLDEQYSDNSRFNYNPNKRPESSAMPSLPLEQTNKNNDFISTEPHTIGHFPRNHGSDIQEETPIDHNRQQFLNPAPVSSYTNDDIVHPNDGRSGAAYIQGRLHNTEQPTLHNYQDSRTSEPLTHATNTQSNHYHSTVPQNQPQQHSLKPVHNFEQQSYKGVSHSQGAGFEDNAGPLTGYEEQYSKTLKHDRDNPNHNLNYRIQDLPVEAERTLDDPSLVKTYQEQTPHFPSSDRNNHQSFVDATTDKQSLNGYLENYEDQNVTYISSDHIDTPENYGQTHSTIRPTYDPNNFPQTTVKSNNYNAQNINYESRVEPQKRITERPIPVRSRTRVRGRTQNQASYSQQTTPASPYQYDEDDQRISQLNQNSHNITKANSDTYEDRSPYATTDHTTVPPNKKFSHTRGRRPLRPTYSTSTSAYPTTTTGAPGTKYLIRTRRPTVAHTKLQSGRGRIRRPTTPTTTTAQPTTTTEYPRTLPFQWRQPVTNDEYVQNDPAQDSVEYREPPQYQIGKTSEIVLQNTQNDRDTNYQQRRNYPKIKTVSYKPEEETVSTHKLYDATETPQYSPNYERSQKPHLSRDFETTPRSQYPREYERNSKPQNTRDYETTPKTYLAKGYGETQKPHYVREYEATQKPHYTREFETTKNPYYPNEYETTQKPQYTRDFITPKPQTNNKYESSQNTQSSRKYEPVQHVQQYDEYESTKSPYTSDFATTHKPQNFRDYEPNTQSYQEYETTQKPFVSQSESKQRTHSSNPARTSNHNHRRRPSAVTRGEIKNSKYNIKPETPTTKNADTDFWNQAVTIQQSQSYVYTPEEDQAKTEESSNSKTNAKTGTLQNDYDDYYTYQEGGQYSSDQSPFPSNDQHVTYTKAKPNQEIGKANQYPEKTGYDKTISDPTKEKEMSDEKSIIQLDSSEQPTDININEEKYLEPPQTSTEDQEPESIEPQSATPGTRKKSGKRRGTWVRVRVKKPKDVFETAESQRFSSVRDNSLIQDDTKTKVFHNEKLNFSKSTLKDDSQNMPHETTTSVEDVNTKVPSENDFLSKEEDKSEFTTTKGLSSNTEKIDVSISSTVMDLPNEFDENLTTMSSTIAPDSTTEFYNQETFRTSTTTEISLETEICYKGQCIKTKRKKNDSDRNSPLLK